MPLTKKGRKIKRAMQQEYGAEKGTSVFYASINKGKVTGAEKGGGKISRQQMAMYGPQPAGAYGGKVMSEHPIQSAGRRR